MNRDSKGKDRRTDLRRRGGEEAIGPRAAGLARYARLCAFALCVAAGAVLYPDGQESGVLPPSFQLELVVLLGVAAVFLLASVLTSWRLVYVSLAALGISTLVFRVALGPGTLALFLSMIASIFAAMSIPTRVGRRPVVVGVVLAAAFLPSPTYVFGQPAPEAHAGLMFAILVVGACLGVTAELLIQSLEWVAREKKRNDQLEENIDNLARVNVGFQAYSQQVGVRSKQQERNRVSREVHDSVGYALTNIAVMLDAAVGLLTQDPDRVRELLNYGREQVDTAHAEVRKALHLLRSLDRSGGYGVKSVKNVVDQFQEATGVDVDLQLVNVRTSYGGHVDTTLCRFVQEGLANAFRHGRATHVEVRLAESEEFLKLNLLDNGTGAEVIEEGIGFVGMRERLSQVSGQLRWQSLPNGFELTCEIPLSATAGD